jgi:hypothetical protein
MKTRLYGDMEKLFDQNDIKYKSSKKNSPNTFKNFEDQDPNKSPEPEDDLPPYVRKKIQKLKN